MAVNIDVRVNVINQIVEFEKEIQKLYDQNKFFINARFNFPQKYNEAWINTNHCQNLLSELLATMSLSYSDNGDYISIA